MREQSYRARIEAANEPHAATVTAAAFRLDGDAIVTACLDGSVRSWKMAAGRERGRSLRHDRGVQNVALGQATEERSGHRVKGVDIPGPFIVADEGVVTELSGIGPG